ncbi:MAG: hypothetical protein PHR81_06085 [Bacteroidales bacterium]|nr:hypothetical protein [Bacteroidales bacterium]MDD4214363.1 hypothetical protein [Bacteroidales bacterium]
MGFEAGKIKDFFIQLFKDVARTVFILFRIMIPISIIVKLLQMMGVVSLIGDALFPVMKYVGLPGEMGLVWATGMMTNLFGGIIAFLNISQGLELSIAQVTVISMMMLVAHTFPIELAIARKTGVRVMAMFSIRFIFAFAFGFVVFKIYQLGGWYNEPAVLAWRPDISADNSLTAWALAELKNYGLIICFIFCLMLLLKVLKIIGVIDLITKGLSPFLKLMGIGKEVSTIALVGLTLGVVYGGALIIDEARSNPKIPKKDIFYAMALMGLCHSVIEDTLLMMALGATFNGVFIIRLFLSMSVVFLLVKITKKIPDKIIYKFLIRKVKHKEINLNPGV